MRNVMPFDTRRARKRFRTVSPPHAGEPVDQATPPRNCHHQRTPFTGATKGAGSAREPRMVANAPGGHGGGRV